MRKLTMALAGAATLLMSSVPAWAAGNVTFTEPEKYADIGWDNYDREWVLKDLGTHIVKLGNKLPADRNLKVEVLDVDLAGRMEHFIRLGGAVRVVGRQADWPRMELRYTLESNGQVLAQGTEKIADMGYFFGHPHYSTSDPLRYEKRMLDRWFKDRIASLK